MHWPYSLDFAGAFLAAQSCAGLMLTALLLYGQIRSRLARGVMLLAVWLAVVAYSLPGFAASIDYKPGTDALRQILAASAAMGTLASAIALSPAVSAVALLGEIPLWLVDGFVKDSEAEICGLHLAWLGLLIGLLVRTRTLRGTESSPMRDSARTTPGASAPSYLAHDAVAFAMTVLLAALTCIFLLRKRDGDADEWAYTYQAAVFAKGRLYAEAPRCQPFLENFYVFGASGRLFSQYTPGWPLLLAPFVALRVTWLGAPVAMGLMVVGIARVARSLTRGFGHGDAAPSERVVAAAGTAAAVLAMLGTCTLVHGASRLSHVPEVALYAWSLEALFVVATPGLERKRQYRWGIVLGCTAAFMLATRPADGAFLGLGIALVFVYELARRRVGWRALAIAAAGFAFWSAVTLVILRVQLGKWLSTGYSLNAVFHPWNVVKYSWPQPNQWKYGLPLATGAYCWWPASMALGLAGLATVRGRSLALLWAITLGCVGYVVYYMYLDVGQRGFDWGYGPRYLMPLLLPMCAGGGVALAPLVVAARQRSTAGRSALARGGPMALAAFAIACGWVRIVPLHWPTVEQHTRRHAGVNIAVDGMHLRNALVLVQPGTTGSDTGDLTTNLPIDLYPQQDVIIAVDKAPEAASCLRAAFPTRRFYRASGTEIVHITPM